MKELLILTTLLLLSYQSFAQQCSANDCPCFMKTGDRYIKKKNYEKAIFNYLVARDCDASLGPSIQKKLSKVFSTIENQKAALANTLKQVEEEQKKTTCQFWTTQHFTKLSSFGLSITFVHSNTSFGRFLK